MSPPGPRVGIDLDGTKIAGIVLDTDDRMAGEARAEMPRDDYRATLGAIAEMVEALKKTCSWATIRVGLGIPGSIGPRSGRVQNANSTWLNTRPLADDLAKFQRAGKRRARRRPPVGRAVNMTYLHSSSGRNSICRIRPSSATSP